ncbi:MAG: acyltransferase [Bacteroidota bacterium]
MPQQAQQFRRLEKLEAIRGLAAFYVFLHHYVHLNPDLAFLRRYFVFGQLAVLVFFVLSGFVIYYSSLGRRPEMPFRRFFIKRFRRIYPPFLLVLALGYLLKSIVEGGATDPRWDELLGNLFMLQDKNSAGSWFYPYLGNSPLWSLSYEWWFYMLFFATMVIGRGRIAVQRGIALGLGVAGFISFQVFPNQISLFAGYFILWWAGREVAQEYLESGRVTAKRQIFSFIATGTLTVAWGIPAYLAWRSVGTEHLELSPFIEFRHFSSVFVVLILGLVWYQLGFPGYRWTLRPFRWLAPVSYALYIIHLPIIAFAIYRPIFGNVWLDFLWVAPLILVLSWLIEQLLQKRINQVLR